MKIQGENFDTLAAAIQPLDTPELRQQYLSGDFPRADQVKDLDRRYRWDLYWKAWFAHEPVRQMTESGMNDAHIETALKRIIPALVTA